MRKNKQKISYIKKPFAGKSFVALGFAAAALACCMVSIGLSIRQQGNGDMNVAAWGLSSIIFSVVALVYGLLSFLEKEKNYILAKISIGVGGLLLVLWFCLVLVGLLG